MVGVLVLVHQQVAEAALVVLQHLREGAEQFDRHHQQVVEVHGRGGEQALLVQAVDLGHPLVVGAAPLGGERLEVDQFVLGLPDGGVEGLGREALGVEAQVADAVLHGAARVEIVVDGEVGAIAQHGSVAAQDAHAGAVEGGYPHAPGNPAHQRGHPLLHLVGGLVGEGDGQQGVRGDAQVADQVGDAEGEHPGLARAGAGHHQDRPVDGGHRLALAPGSGRRRGGNRPRGAEYTEPPSGESDGCD